MADEMPTPRVISVLANRGRQIDAATDAAVNPTAPAAKPAPASNDKPDPATVSITPGLADQMAAKSAARKKQQAADDAAATARGAPNPGIMDRILKTLTPG